MKAKIILLANNDEIINAERESEKYGSVDIPKPEFVDSDFLFNFEDVRMAYMFNNGKGIRILIIDDWFDLSFNQTLWNNLLNKYGGLNNS